MSTKMLVALCCLGASLASQALEVHEDDTVVLLQSQIEEKLVVHQTATIDSETTTSEYNVASALECTATKDKVVDCDVPAVVASETASKQMPSAHASYSSDPPGASSTRALLRLMCLLLVLDGLRRWWLQKEQASIPKETLSGKAQAATQDEEAMKRNWAELVSAAKNGEESCFKQALSHRSMVTASDPWGCTALHFAAVGGSATITQELLKHGAEIDALDADDETPLHFAARAGHTRTCEVLVTSGAKIDAVNKKGLTPFVVAGESNKEQACRFLADHGAGVAGLADEELPPLVISQIVRKMLAA